jgi:hypothetical protein
MLILQHLINNHIVYIKHALATHYSEDARQCFHACFLYYLVLPDDCSQHPKHVKKSYEHKFTSSAFHWNYSPMQQQKKYNIPSICLDHIGLRLLSKEQFHHWLLRDYIVGIEPTPKGFPDLLFIQNIGYIISNAKGRNYRNHYVLND